MTLGKVKRAYYRPKGRESVRMEGYIQLPAVYTFVLENDEKAQGLKVLEEASELSEAVKSGDEEAARYEAMDVLQALGNLIERMGWSDEQMREAYNKVKARNKIRGRYKVQQ